MRSADGNRGGGQGLKKSPVEGTDHRIRRRKRFERTAAPLPDMVPSWANTGTSVPFQLEDDFGDRGYHMVDFLLSAFSGNNPESTGCGIPYSSDAANPRRSSCDLGWAPKPSESDGQGFC